MRKGCCHGLLMCLFRPLNVVLGVAGVALLSVGAYMFFACLHTHVGIPNALDIILLSTGLFLAALHFGVMCCESTQCCLCLYQALTATLAACELTFTVLFFIPAIREEIINGTEHLIANASSGGGTSVVCNISGLVEDVSTTGSNSLMYFAIVMLALILLQGFLIMVASCHGDAVHNEKVDRVDEANRQALLDHQAQAQRRRDDDVGVRQYKTKHQAIFDKYKGKKKGGRGSTGTDRKLPDKV